MRKFKDVKQEFDKDFDNIKITNETMNIKYIKSIISDHINSDEITVKEKEKFELFEKEALKRLEERPDIKNEIEEKLLKLQEDIMKGYRVYSSSKGRIGIKFPGVLDDEEVELECSKLYNRLLQMQGDDRMLTEAEIIDRLEERGVWNKEKEEKLEKILEYYKDANLLLNSEKLKEDPNMDKVLELQKDSNNFEKQYDELSNLKNKHVQNSIETRVEELRLRSKLLKCVYNVKEEEDGNETLDTPFWEGIDNLKVESKTFVSVFHYQKEGYLELHIFYWYLLSTH